MKFFKSEGIPKVAIVSALSISILIALSAWFFTARDDRGRTARLTADAWYYHAYLPSLVFDQDVDFQNEFKVTKNWYRLGKTPVGRQSNVFGVGPAIYEMPFFLLGHGIASITGSESNGFSKIEVECSLFASLLFSLGALFFAARLIRRRLGGAYFALATSLLVFMGAPVVYYAIRQPGYAHPFATFWAAWLIDYWDASYSVERTTMRSRRFWIGMGLLIGAASLARPQLVLWSILGGAAAISDLLIAREAQLDRNAILRQIGNWAMGAVLAFIVVLPQLLVWKALYGSYIASPQGEGFMRWGESAWLETLFSSRNGLLPWSPIYVLGAIGLVMGLFRHTRICSLLILGVLVQAFVNGAAWDWWAGGSFGGRRFDSCFIVFVFGTGVLIHTLWNVCKQRRWIGQALGVGAMGLCTALALANLKFASTKSGPTARIYGGTAASHILGKRGGVAARSASWVSAAGNLPMRLYFSWKHSVPLHAYDRLAGVHQLGELFPGLNSFRGKRRQNLNLDSRYPGTFGLTNETGKPVASNGTVTLLLGLNRTDVVEVHLRTEMLEQAPEVYLNDTKISVTERIPPAPGYFIVTLDNYERGVNTLRIEAPQVFILNRVELVAKGQVK